MATAPNKVKPIKLNKNSDILFYLYELFIKYNYFRSIVKRKTKNAVILCHGYGGDGKDISILAGYWRAHLPETIFNLSRCSRKMCSKSNGISMV